MARRYPNPRLIKLHRSYTPAELARILCKHPNTIRNWVKDGLESFGDGRTVLISAASARAYLEGKRQLGRRRCPAGTLYCFNCKEPRRPAFDEVELHLDVAGRRKLTGLCSVCSAIMTQAVSAERLSQFRRILTVTPRTGSPTLLEGADPVDICD